PPPGGLHHQLKLDRIQPGLKDRVVPSSGTGHLELGGKSAAIVLDDAELDLAQIGQQLFMATMLNNGQTCFLSTRILAPRIRYAEVVEVMKQFADSLVVGDSLDPPTQIGPMVSQRQRDRVEDYIAKGKAEGGRIVTGGGRPEAQERGWFVQPTVFDGVDNNATIAREEIFGPVLTVLPYENVDEAVSIANDSEYGLRGPVWTSDLDRGMQIARRVQTGSFGINTYFPDPVAPIGGVKASGIGREYGPEALASYQHLISIYH
ncbi:aldehyde dehydrogenase family protein, partial [Nocardia sp. NPDC051911]|uniref:aldehyde dehydrogenase family protein n=1 Tax=Nocardia sp. NPDC051911 TaxID=3154648 RepID=UPI00341EAEE0